MRSVTKILFLIIIFGVVNCTAFSQGGPPMLIDDPVPVEKGHWEINNGFILEHSASLDEFQMPLEDFNYGFNKNMHIKYEVPLILKHESGSPAIGGLGKSSIGVKWRFYNNERINFSISAFPAFSFNTLSSSAERGITEKGIEFTLPLSFLLVHHNSSYVVEIGRQFSSQNQGGWIYGSLYDIRFSEKADIAVEFFGNSDFKFTENEIFLNAGARINLSRHFNLMFSAGNNFIYHNAAENKFIAYLGLQIAL